MTVLFIFRMASKVNFRTKFKDKIRFVHKRGLKETLMADRPAAKFDLLHQDSSLDQSRYNIVLSPLKSSRRCYTLSADQPPQRELERSFKPQLMRNNISQIVQSEPTSPLKHQYSNQKPSKISTFLGKEEKKKPRFIDQMFWKHRNLIQMIDMKTKWKQRASIKEDPEKIEKGKDSSLKQTIFMRRRHSPNDREQTHFSANRSKNSPQRMKIDVRFQ